VLRCFVTRVPGERVLAQLQAANGGSVRTRLTLRLPPHGEQSRQAVIPFPQQADDGRLLNGVIDLTPDLAPDDAYFHLTVRCERAPGPGADLAPALTRIELRFDAPPPPSVRLGAAVFFGVVGLFGWWVLLGFLPPRLGGYLRQLWRIRPTRRGRLAVAVLMLVVMAGLAAHPIWRDPKEYDDRWALSNARLLAARRFHTEDLFFRSRVRPGFLAVSLPPATCLPHVLASVSYNPADFQQRLFYVFDRTGATWGTRIYPEATLWGLLLALAGVALTGACGLMLDHRPGRRTRALLTSLLAAWFLHRTLGGPLVSPITLSVTWTFHLAAMLAFLELLRFPGRRTCLTAGLLTGLAILLKEDALALILPIALLQADDLWLHRSERFRPAYFIAFWLLAAAPAMLYYGAIIDGGFGEILTSMRQHLASQPGLANIQTRSLAGAGRALTAVFGLGLAPAAVGLIGAFRPARFANPATRLALYWLIGGCTPFLLPYFYPRFFLYMIAPMAWLAADALTSVGGWLAASSGRSPATAPSPPR
jgi:hypothetical protein